MAAIARLRNVAAAQREVNHEALMLHLVPAVEAIAEDRYSSTEDVWRSLSSGNTGTVIRIAAEMDKVRPDLDFTLVSGRVNVDGQEFCNLCGDIVETARKHWDALKSGGAAGSHSTTGSSALSNVSNNGVSSGTNKLADDLENIANKTRKYVSRVLFRVQDRHVIGVLGAACDQFSTAIQHLHDMVLNSGDNGTPNNSFGGMPQSGQPSALALADAKLNAKLNLLGTLALLHGAPEHVMRSLAGKLEYVKKPAFDTVIKYGDLGDSMYFVASGSIEVLSDKNKTIRTVQPGAYIGEIALVRGVLRTATCITKEPTELFALNREAFLTAVNDFPELRDRLLYAGFRSLVDGEYPESVRYSEEMQAEIDQKTAQLVADYHGSQKRHQWQIGNRIGGGASGTVHEALDTQSGQIFAVKIIKTGDADAAGVTSLQQDVMWLATLSHPHIVRGLGAEYDDASKSMFVFMELVPGGTLRGVVDQFGPLSEAVVKDYAYQCLKALGYLHAMGILHRDVKPSNLLLTTDGVVKLADFGLSLRNLCFTTHTLVGTPAYLSPAAISGKYSIRSDLWALGCTIVELLTGIQPWSDGGSSSPTETSTQQTLSLDATVGSNAVVSETQATTTSSTRSFEGPAQLMFYIATSNQHPTVPVHLSDQAKDFLDLMFAAKYNTAEISNGVGSAAVNGQRTQGTEAPLDAHYTMRLLSHPWFTQSPSLGSRVDNSGGHSPKPPSVPRSPERSAVH